MTDDSRNTQRNKILGLLVAAQGREVPLPEITAMASQYGARILELRRMGYRILNRKQRLPNGQVHSWFRLEPRIDEAAAQKHLAAGLFAQVLANGCHRDSLDGEKV